MKSSSPSQTRNVCSLSLSRVANKKVVASTSKPFSSGRPVCLPEMGPSDSFKSFNLEEKLES